MGRSRCRGRLLGTLLMIVLIPLFLRVTLVKWWLILPLAATGLICYTARVRSPFLILLVVAIVVVGVGFLF